MKRSNPLSFDLYADIEHSYQSAERNAWRTIADNH
jgi:hypothetical protein